MEHGAGLLQPHTFLIFSKDRGEWLSSWFDVFNPLNAELNPICSLLALLGFQLIFHVSRIRVNTKK
jgi:hypothetical protein